MPAALLPAVSGVWRWALVDVTGVEHACNPGDSTTILAGPSGMLGPPVQVFDRELPLLAGAQRQGARIATREFDVPFLITGPSLASVVNQHEQLLSWLDPTRGSGTITWRVTRPDDTRRDLVATYVGGLEGEETHDNGVETWWRGVATFRAHDPFWHDTDAISQTFALDPVSGTWFPIVFPVVLAGSQVYKRVNLLNDGTAETWPRFVITGPGTSPVVRNLTTGTFLGLAWTLLAGETVTIDMAPLVERPIVETGGNSIFQQRTTGSERWALVPGNNLLQIEMAGATTASSVVLSYRRRWWRR